MEKWTIHNDSDDFSQYRIELDGHGIIMRISDESDKAEANARAIAAVPELVSALQACITHPGAHCLNVSTHDALWRRLDAINTEARAALAKAGL